MQPLLVAREAGATFGEFLHSVWLPLHQGSWKRGTQITTTDILMRHLSLWMGRPLSTIRSEEIALWLFRLARLYSHSLTKRCYMLMRSICAEAHERGLIKYDPAHRLKLPRTKPIQRPFLDAEGARRLVAATRTLRDSLILRLFLVGGFRAGELFALRWHDVNGNHIRVDEALHRGVLDLPKTKASCAWVTVSGDIAKDLEEYRRETAPGVPEAFLFPTSTGRPIDPKNYRRDVLDGCAKRAGLQKVTYQMLRRSCATIAAAAGVPIKALQAQMRHSDPAMTLAIYAQIVPESQHEAAAIIAHSISNGRQ